VIWIVSGPSSAGKSRFLESPRAAQVTGLPPGTRVWFPKEIGPGAPPKGEDAFVHYNILRPFQRAERPGDVAVGPRLFTGDEKWRAILALPGAKKAVVVVADRETLVRRVRERKAVETDDPHAYGQERWLRIYEAVDLAAVWREWRAELTRNGIAFVEVDGGGAA
jgi:hypothetical protein